MYEIPTTINIEGTEFHIRNNGDYRMVLDCFSALQDADMAQQERIFASLIIFYDDVNDLSDLNKFPSLEKAVSEMYNFFNCNQVQGIGKHVNYKLIDWEQDSQIICSAVNAVANKEIRSEPYIHWWTFMGYYASVGESLLSTIVTIRNKIIKGKKLEKYERQFRNENPEYFTWRSKSVEAEEADALIKEIWNKGG